MTRFKQAAPVVGQGAYARNSERRPKPAGRACRCLPNITHACSTTLELL